LIWFSLKLTPSNSAELIPARICDASASRWLVSDAIAFSVSV